MLRGGRGEEWRPMPQHRHYYIKPPKHAPETGSRNRRHRSKCDARFGVSFSCRRTTSNVIDCRRAPKAVNDVRSRASARKTGAVESGVEVIAQISGAISAACVRGLALHQSYLDTAAEPLLFYQRFRVYIKHADEERTTRWSNTTTVCSS